MLGGSQMQDDNSTFGSVAAGVFVGGIALVLCVVFWQIALFLLGAVIALSVLVLVLTNKDVRDVVLGIAALIAIVAWFYMSI